MIKKTVAREERIIEAICDMCGGDCMKDFYLSEGDHDDRGCSCVHTGQHLFPDGAPCPVHCHI